MHNVIAPGGSGLMNWLYLPYIISLYGSAILSIALVIFLWEKRAAPGVNALVFLLGALAEWSLCSAIQLSRFDLPWQLFWSSTQYIGITLIPITWLIFVLTYTNRTNLLTRRFYLLFAIEPLAVTLAAWTNSFHHLIWVDASLDLNSPLSGLSLTYNIAFWIHAAYSYLLVLSGAILLYRTYRDASPNFRKQSVPILIAAAVVPLSINLIYVFRLFPSTNLDLTPLTFTISGVLIVWGLRRYWLFDLIPVARSAVIEGMRDGVFVLDDKHRIVDLNRSAVEMLALPFDKAIGAPASQVFAVWPQLLEGIKECLANPGAGGKIIDIHKGVPGSGERFYELEVLPFTYQEGYSSGILVTCRDNTDRKQTEEALVASRQRYRQSVENSPNPIFSVTRDGIIQSWNQACENVFQYGQAILGCHYRSILSNRNEQKSLDEKIAGVFERKVSLSNVDLSYRCKDGEIRFMVSRLYAVVDENGSVEACVFANTDITERKRADEILHRQLQELTVLHAVGVACVEASSEDELIERTTEIIGKSLFTDNFGILYTDEKAGTLHFHPSYRGLPAEKRETVIPLGQGITGIVAASGSPKRVSDVTQSQAYLHLHFRTRAELCVPIKIGDHVVGVVNAESAHVHAFTEADERVMVTLAGQLATAIKRLRAEAAERHRVDELLVITRVSREITSVLDHQAVLDSIVRHAAELSYSDASGILTYQPDGHYYLVAAYGVSQGFIDAVNQQGVQTDGSAIGRAVSLMKPFQIEDVYLDPGYSPKKLADIENIRAILALPMLSGERVIGGIVLWHRSPYRFASEDILYLQALAQQSVNAIENARLFEAEREQRELAEALREIGATLAATLDLDTILDRVLDQIARLVPYDISNVLLVQGDRARIARTRGLDDMTREVYRRMGSLTYQIAITADLRQMVETRQALIIDDIREDPDWIEVGITRQVRSFAGVPVVDQDQVVAFFTLNKIEPNFYQPEHTDRLAIFASQAGLALQNARLFDETRRRLREVTLLSKIITLTAASDDLDEALNQICIEVALFFQAQQTGFALLNAERSSAQVIAEYRSPGRPSGVGLRIPVAGNPSMEYILENKTPMAISDAQNDPLMEPIHDLMRSLGVASILLVPILMKGQVAGTLGIDMLEPHEFGQADVDLMQNIARQVSQVFDRLQLFAAAQEHAEQMALLAALSGAMNHPVTAVEVISGIGQGAMQLGGCKRAAVYQRYPDRTVYCAWYAGLSSAYLEAVTRQADSVPGGRMLDSPEKILIGDIMQLPQDSVLRGLAEKEGFRVVGLWPLVYEERVIAAVGCYYDQPQTWPLDQQEVMLAFTRQASVALQNARLFEETRRRAAQQEAINAIITAAVTAPDLSRLLEVVLDLTLKAFGLEKGAIWASRSQALRGLPENGLAADPAALHSVYRAITGSIVINDWKKVCEEDLLSEVADQLRRMGVSSALIVPVRVENHDFGGMSLVSSSPREWQEEEIALAESVGRQLGSAIERLNLLAKTQEQAQQVRQIIDTVPEGVLLLDSGHRIVLANPAGWGYSAILVGEAGLDAPVDSLAGQPVSELLEQNNDSLWRELEVEGDVHKTFEIAARPLEAGDLTQGWVFVIRDITQERDNQARIQMQDRLATVGQLAAGIAHDFNNIMAAITVYTDLLGMEPNLSAASHERLNTIQQQVQRATSLIRQILDFSRRSVMEQSSMDLLPFIKELDKLLGRILPENIRLELTYQPGEYIVKADPTRLQQVFMNLALNARDAMPSGGTLHFELGRIYISDTDVLILDLTPGEWIGIQVSDTGTGIQPDAMAHIFDPFFTTKPVGGGTGLGLAQVYGIVKQHRGSIDVRSAPGEGTTFEIYLPALEILESGRAAGENRPPRSGNGETILLVEDDPAALEAMKALLSHHNFRVLPARNGVEAMQVYDRSANTIDLVVSDVVMPEMGGVELYRSLKEKAPELKMLFVTGHPLGGENQSLLEEGQVDWLQKPFAIQEFVRVLQTLLRSNGHSSRAHG